MKKILIIIGIVITFILSTTFYRYEEKQIVKDFLKTSEFSIDIHSEIETNAGENNQELYKIEYSSDIIKIYNYTNETTFIIDIINQKLLYVKQNYKKTETYTFFTLIKNVEDEHQPKIKTFNLKKYVSNKMYSKDKLTFKFDVKKLLTDLNVDTNSFSNLPLEDVKKVKCELLITDGKVSSINMDFSKYISVREMNLSTSLESIKFSIENISYGDLPDITYTYDPNRYYEATYDNLMFLYKNGMLDTSYGTKIQPE